MKNRYVYSVLRFVPNPASGEFVNIGAIAGSDDSREWELRTIENYRRARQIDTQEVLPKALFVINDMARQIDEYVDSTEELFPTEFEINEKWLRNYYEVSQNVIQFSPPAPMLADNLDNAFQDIFDELITDPARKKHQTITKHTALSSIKRAYTSHKINFGKNLFEKAEFRTSKYSGNLDFVVANGKALQLTQAWSFQVQNQFELSEHIKSWAWTVHDLRDQGASVKVGKKEIEIPSSVEIDIVYIPPIKGQDDSVFLEAKSAFEDVKATIYENGEEFSFVDKAASLLKSSGR